jgi:pyridoxine/pyridoxamine 5'-phosphate oxidase
MANASEFTRSLLGEDSWTAQQVVDFVNEQQSATIATVNGNGQPHAAMVIAASANDAFFFTVSPETVLARNVTSNNRIGLSVSDSSRAVVGQGRAERVGAATELSDLISEVAAASPSGRFTPNGWDGDIFRVDFTRLFAS